MSTKTLLTEAEFYAWAQDAMASNYYADKKYTLKTRLSWVPVLGADGEPLTEKYTPWKGEAEETRTVTKSVERFYLDECGSGGRYSWHSNEVFLPDTISEALAKGWKRKGGNSYARDNFVGARGLKSILALVDANAATEVVERAKVQRAEREARQEKMKRNNQRRDIIAACAELLSAMDGSPDIARDVYAGAAYRAVMDYASHVLNDREA